MSKPCKVRNFVAMLRGGVQVLYGTVALLAASGLSVHAQVSVITWHNDAARTGQNLNETILNTSNVNATQFGKLFSQTVDGYIYTQPLYLPNLMIGGQLHNVVFVATEHDSVYAFDADNNAGGNANPLWSASLLTAAHGAATGATTIPESSGSDIYPEIGITGTPVIDPVSGTLYVVSATLTGINYVQLLHALDVTSGAEKFGGPVLISPTVSGTGNGSVNGTLTFDPEWENQRPGLLLLNGIVYVGFASHDDDGPFHGWILAYNAQTLSQTSALCVSPNGTDGGIWMGGAGLAAEVIDPVNHPFGRMFVATANGDYTAAKPYAAGMDFGDTILNLDLTNGVPTVQDNFTPAIQATEDQNDGDQGAGGLLILPNQTTGSYPHLLVQAGKSGEVYLLNRENLGGYNTSGDQVVQGLPYAVGNVGTWTMPAYWNGTVYYWGVNDTLKAFPLVNGQLTGPTAISSETYGFPGANPSISANGNTQGIIWSIDSESYGPPGGPALLQAHNASNPGTTLYSSSTNASRDNPGQAVKFTVPTVVNGKVYVGAQYQMSVFGLLGGQQMTASPQLSPGAEAFAGSLEVSMTDATNGATIYYTLDGSTPTVSSKVYTTPITITATTTIQVMASAPGYLQSSVSSETYVGSSQASAPTFSLAAGIYSAAQSVTMSDATTGATIYYTTNGTTPTISSTQYTGAISVSATETIEAIAVATAYSSSPVSTATYTITPPAATPVFSLTPGTYISAQSVSISDATNGSTIYYTTNGTTPTTSSTQYSGAISVSATETIEAIALAAGYSSSIVSTATYTITALAATPAFSPTPGTYISTQSVSISDATTGATIYYTTNGTTPTTSSTQYSGAISVSATETIEAIAVATAYSSSPVSTATYTITPPAATPAFSPTPGTYTSTQSVSISDATTGATIYYTTDGATPTPSSTKYTGAITVSSTETLEAIAVAIGYSQSALASAPYTISLPTLSFTVSGTAVTLSAPGATTGNTSIITVMPVGDFTGSVALTAAVTSSPNGAQNLPTLNFGSTTPVNITTMTAGTATLTITTTAASSAKTTFSKHLGVPWYAAGSTALSFVLLFGFPSRRRCWRTMLGMLVLLAALGGGVLACSGGVAGGGGGPTNSGTTAGDYTVTLTGTSGKITETSILALTVQ